MATLTALRMMATMKRPDLRRHLPLILLIVGLLVYPLFTDKPFYIHVPIRTFVFASVAQAWNLLGGYTGQTNLGQAVFFGTGAYSAAILMIEYHISPWIGMLFGCVLAVLLSMALGYPTFGLVGRYFAIATLGIGEIGQLIALNWGLTGRAVGRYIPIVHDSVWWIQFHRSKEPYYYIALAIMAFAFIVTASLEKTRMGYYWRAIKADQDAAQSLGIPVRRYKMIAAGISAWITAMVGAFYANYVLVVDPFNTLKMDLSIMFMLVAVLGGVGTLWGPFLGALVIIPLSEFTRSQLGGGGGGVDLMVYAALIVIIVMFEPKGILGLLNRLSRRLTAGGGRVEAA